GILKKNGYDVGTVTALEVTERTQSLRVSSLTVHGTRSSVRRRGNDFRRMVGYETVKSTLFAVALDGAVARFSGRGYGHGVGMSQWGAKGMAEQGYKAEKILEYYYPGTTLGWLGTPTRGRFPGRTSRRSTCGSVSSPTPRSSRKPGVPPFASGSTSGLSGPSARARRSPRTTAPPIHS